MENASKALIIASGILIAILIISLLVTGWNKITDYSRVHEEIETEEQITNFNKEFESYNKRVVRGYELISLENLVYDTNTRYTSSNGFKKLELYIKFLKGTTLVETLTFDTEKNKTDDKMKKQITESYIDIQTYRSYYDDALGKNQDLSKIYKESYFQCDKMVYDGENEEDEGKGSARIQKMYFTQIEKKNNI